MENANDHQATVASGGHLRKLLKEVDVGPVSCRSLKDLAHLVDEHDDATGIVRVPERYPPQRIQSLLFGPATAQSPPQFLGMDGLLNQSLGPVPAAHYRQD